MGERYSHVAGPGRACTAGNCKSTNCGSSLRPRCNQENVISIQSATYPPVCARINAHTRSSTKRRILSIKSSELRRWAPWRTVPIAPLILAAGGLRERLSASSARRRLCVRKSWRGDALPPAARLARGFDTTGSEARSEADISLPASCVSVRPRKRSMLRRLLRSLTSQKEIATPSLPARAVRPIR